MGRGFVLFILMTLVGTSVEAQQATSILKLFQGSVPANSTVIRDNSLLKNSLPAQASTPNKNVEGTQNENQPKTVNAQRVKIFQDEILAGIRPAEGVFHCLQENAANPAAPNNDSEALTPLAQQFLWEATLMLTTVQMSVRSFAFTQNLSTYEGQQAVHNFIIGEALETLEPLIVQLVQKYPCLDATKAHDALRFQDFFFSGY